MKKSALFLFLIASFTAAGQQKEYSVKDVTDRLQKRYDALQDATARFTQHVKFGFSKIEQDFSGTLHMKRPNKYRIETEYQTLVTDGVTVWSYSPVNKQVLVDHFKETPESFAPEQLLLNLPNNYFASLMQQEKTDGKNWIAMKLVPKDDQSFIKSMKVWVEEGAWIVRKVELVDVNDTEKIYTVLDIKMNTGLKDDTFAFTAPAGTELVDLR